MPVPQIQQAIEIGSPTLKTLGDALNELAKMLGPNKEAFAFGSDIPGLPSGISIKRLWEEASATITLLSGLASLEDGRVIPDGLLAALTSVAAQYRDAVVNFSNGLTAFQMGGDITQLD